MKEGGGKDIPQALMLAISNGIKLTRLWSNGIFSCALDATKWYTAAKLGLVSSVLEKVRWRNRTSRVTASIKYTCKLSDRFKLLDLLERLNAIHGCSCCWCCWCCCSELELEVVLKTLFNLYVSLRFYRDKDEKSRESCRNSLCLSYDIRYWLNIGSLSLSPT